LVSDYPGGFEGSCIWARDQPAEAEGAQYASDGLRLVATIIGEIRVSDTGIAPGGGKNTVKFGLAVANQNHSNSFM